MIINNGSGGMTLGDLIDAMRKEKEAREKDVIGEHIQTILPVLKKALEAFNGVTFQMKIVKQGESSTTEVDFTFHPPVQPKTVYVGTPPGTEPGISSHIH